MALGGKPGVIWKGYELRRVLQAPDEMPRADFLNVWAKVADYVNLKSFQWGMFPGYKYLPGMDKLQRDLPLLRECIRAGRQPVCPVEHAGDETLWMGRYGAGAGTYLAIGNPTAEPVAADPTVHGEALGDVDCVFVNAKEPAAPVAQAVAHRMTKLSVECPMRRETVLRSVPGVRCEESLECVALMEEDLDRIVTRVGVSSPAAEEAVPAIPELRGFDVASVTLDGEACGDRTSLKRGENVVEVTYRSRHFGFGREALDEFEFLTDEGEMAFAVVAAEPDERAYRRVRERFEHMVPFLPVYGMAGRHLTARKLYGLTMTEALAEEGQTW